MIIKITELNECVNDYLTNIILTLEINATFTVSGGIILLD